MTRKVRVRFAPSPTGPLHIGGVRTALFNYLFARQHGGDFILRIEDTDSSRYVPGAEEYIFRALKWCGLTVDEGVEQGGHHAPYRQSERKGLYWQYAQKLVQNGWAYYAFDSADNLAKIRGEYEAKGESFAYGPKTRSSLDNSLNLTDEEIAHRLSDQADWVIRFKIPEDRTVQMHDLIRGDISVHTSTLDDKVLYKHSDGLPTYHLANIVDDHLMAITHVIRGEEWLPSLPLHYLLYEALEWKDSQPEFAHLPLILKPTGNGKLSKRDGEKLGFPVFPLAWTAADGAESHGYREDGYLPEAFLNMLALLGWHPETPEEIMPLETMIEQFSLERVTKSGARFDPEKAKWFNHEYIQRVKLSALEAPVIQELALRKISINLDRVDRAIELVRERADLLSDLWHESDYLFVAPQTYDAKGVKKHTSVDTAERLVEVCNWLKEEDLANGSTLLERVKRGISENAWPMGKMLNSIRLALVGEPRGIDLADIIDFLGSEETINRLRRFSDSLR